LELEGAEPVLLANVATCSMFCTGDKKKAYTGVRSKKEKNICNCRKVTHHMGSQRTTTLNACRLDPCVVCKIIRKEIPSLNLRVKDTSLSDEDDDAVDHQLPDKNVQQLVPDENVWNMIVNGGLQVKYKSVMPDPSPSKKQSSPEKVDTKKRKR